MARQSRQVSHLTNLGRACGTRRHDGHPCGTRRHDGHPVSYQMFILCCTSLYCICLCARALDDYLIYHCEHNLFFIQEQIVRRTGRFLQSCLKGGTHIMEARRLGLAFRRMRNKL